MSIQNPSRGEVDLALTLIESDTVKSQIKPTPEQYESLADEVAAYELGRAVEGGSVYQNKCRDLMNLFDFVPKVKFSDLRKQVYEFGTALLSIPEAEWILLFRSIKAQIDTELSTSKIQQEMLFWKILQTKFNNFLKKYHINL